MKSVKIKDKEFELFIESGKIANNIARVADQINADLKGKNPLFLVVLNGAFMFAAELMKKVSIPCEITFIRLASYKGTSSTESVTEILGLTESIENRTVVIVEDIVDSGNTLATLIEELKKHHPCEIKIASLLLKPGALKYDLQPDYIAMEVPPDFLVGYGLDYDGYGRNLADIYKLKN
ncbi:hypoxanthine phosphoribosyltransferase [Anaerorudis cellulosivorans]|uniref:hypoxanthine phosphoribosyltransferase n=1 Tax=Anaerorudis cellulosivorans TaxID=3397862 RepID=UPI00221FED22|nr:hypoxanthine phosphoribosyltransferase [Seramator thermalis]MCW1735592.1 hypoxanthine phosphoribosyltransferase [Seramator thermalis]